jgi:hypothetical protein
VEAVAVGDVTIKKFEALAQAHVFVSTQLLVVDIVWFTDVTV